MGVEKKGEVVLDNSKEKLREEVLESSGEKLGEDLEKEKVKAGRKAELRSWGRRR